MNILKIILPLRFYYSLFFLLGGVHLNTVWCQNYWILYCDAKDSTRFPALSEDAIHRRIQQGIALDILDLPVNPERIIEVSTHPDVSVKGVSRWLNALLIYTHLSKEELSHTFSWHKGILISPKLKTHTSEYISSISDAQAISEDSVSVEYGFATQQNLQIGLNCLHNQGFTGKDVKIAVFDSGFRNVDQISAFDTLFLENRMLHTYDFVDQEENVYNDDNHGTHVLSIISGQRGNLYKGAAWNASIILARTETIFSETKAEEFNWAIAMEWADSLGADIIQASLGYNYFDMGIGNYTYADLDGQTAIITRAASIAVSRGMMVVVSAGNEGGNSWGYITVPADADSILAVGSVNNVGIRSGTSSYGPTADGRIKPDVMAMGEGTAIVTSSGLFSFSSGTSFAAPLISGLAACLRESFPSVPSRALTEAIRHSGSKALNPDNLMGYGIANACRADSLLRIYLEIHPNLTQNFQIHLYPNPAQDDLFYSLPEGFQVHSIQVYDIQGRVMDLPSSEPGHIYIADLVPGKYFIRFQGDTTFRVSSFIRK